MVPALPWLRPWLPRSSPWLPCLLLCALGAVMVSRACDETLCASLVSKCLLLKACECDLTDKANCTCCKDCHRCLSKLYTECCDCVGMCPPKTPHDYKQSLEHASSIEELREPIPALFEALTEEEDPEGRWAVYSYPAHLDLLYFNPRGQQGTTLTGGSPQGHPIRHGTHHLVLEPGHGASTNCTVAFHAQCMSLNKCKSSCQSMGARRYRWFHQYGCCECIGHTCLDYGKGEALCSLCPLPEDHVEDDEGGYYYTDDSYNDDYDKDDHVYGRESNTDYEAAVEEVLQEAAQGTGGVGANS